MKTIFNNLKENKTCLYFIVLIAIVLDIVIAKHFDPVIRIFVNYLFVPAIMIYPLTVKHMSYYILLIYEIFISLVAYFELSGFSVFTYFITPDIWHLFNELSLDLGILNLPMQIQPIIIIAIETVFVLLFRRMKKKTKNTGDGSVCSK